jgi:hypothetical protein
MFGTVLRARVRTRGALLLLVSGFDYLRSALCAKQRGVRTARGEKIRMTVRVDLERLSLDGWYTDAPEILTYLRAHAAGDGSLAESMIERVLVAGIVALSQIGKGVRPDALARRPAPPAPAPSQSRVLEPIWTPSFSASRTS